MAKLVNSLHNPPLCPTKFQKLKLFNIRPFPLLAAFGLTLGMIILLQQRTMVAVGRCLL